MSAQPLLDDPMVSFEGDLRMSPLEPMVVSEEPRHGAPGPQSRGFMLPVWDDVLPPADPDLLAENRRQVAAVMAKVSGEVLV